MQNVITATNTGINAEAPSKKKTHKLMKRVLLCIAIYAGFMLAIQLPGIVKAVFVTAGLVVYFYPRISAVILRLRSGSEKTITDTRRVVSRFSQVAATLSSMSDEEFESHFPAVNTNQVQAPANTFVPTRLCKPVMTKEAAHATALAWWEEEGSDGMTGMQQISDLLAAIACNDPTKHTAVLNEHDELGLPTGQLVLSELVNIMKANGIDADISADSDIIVFWNQYEDGTEAAQAHAEAK